MAFDWSEFYSAQGGRGVRATFTSGLDAWLGDEPGDALDLGCGDGVETHRLAELGWRVVAVDEDPGVEERVLAEVGRGAARPWWRCVRRASRLWGSCRPAISSTRASRCRSASRVAFSVPVGGHP